MPSEAEVLSELDLGPPPQELILWAKENINEDPDTRCKVIEEFRNLIFNRGECSPHRTDDSYLLRFLRARYFKLEPSHKLLVNYYNFKDENPEFFQDVKLKDLKRIGEYDIISVPPYRDQDGRRTLLYRIGNWDTKKVTIDELFQASLAILELAVLEERAQILGGNCIFDLEGITMSHAWNLTPSVASKIIQIMVTSFPMKIQAIHVVNQSWIFDIMFNVIKPLLNERMRERLHYHGTDYESLHEFMDPKYLPERYGGVHPDYSYNDWIDYCHKTEKIIEEMRSLGYDDVDNDVTTSEENSSDES